jgi:putative toxin-antitoxin system antitoxin component (TIGR02293 family)
MSHPYPHVMKVVESLGGRRLLKSSIRTVAELDSAVRSGLPYRSFVRVAERFPEAERARLERVVAPRSTLQRRQREGVLSAEESERLERVARLVALAEQVWESPEAARRFLTTPHPQLDNKIPLELAATELGARRVEALLWKLEYSLPV